MTEGDYVDLVVNPERFTGYVGGAAHRVWSAIYEENCFGLSEASWASEKSVAPAAVFGSVVKQQALEVEPLCLEKRVYYKVISGTCVPLCCFECF